MYWVYVYMCITILYVRHQLTPRNTWKVFVECELFSFYGLPNRELSRCDDWARGGINCYFWLDFVWESLPLGTPLSNTPWTLSAWFTDAVDKQNTRRSVKMGRMSSKQKRNKKQKLIDLFGHYCWWCGQCLPEDKLTIEHLLPQSRGGSKSI